MISRRPAGQRDLAARARAGPGRPARVAGVPGRAGQARCDCRPAPVRCRVASMPAISPIRCTMIRRRSQISLSASRGCLPRGGAGSGVAATMALARSRPDWCRHGLRDLLSGALQTVTTAPSRGATYPPYLFGDLMVKVVAWRHAEPGLSVSSGANGPIAGGARICGVGGCVVRGGGWPGCRARRG